MTAGDETVIGPYPCNDSGVASTGAEMNTAYVGTSDHYVSISGANNMQHWVIHIEGSG